MPCCLGSLRSVGYLGNTRRVCMRKYCSACVVASFVLLSCALRVLADRRCSFHIGVQSTATATSTATDTCHAVTSSLHQAHNEDNSQTSSSFSTAKKNTQRPCPPRASWTRRNASLSKKQSPMACCSLETLRSNRGGESPSSLRYLSIS